jgi:hypothetical protein
MMKRMFIIFLAAVFFILIIYLLLCGSSSFRHGYSWGEMDWNNDGKTTIAEFFEASDIGRRNVIVDGRPCVEYFAFKDGLAVRIDCHDGKKRSQGGFKNEPQNSHQP